MREVVGVIPAAGRGSRLPLLPLSKELYPLGYETGPDGQPRLRVVIQHVLEAMQRAGASRVFVIVGSGKEDILEQLGDGSRFGFRIAYLFQQELRGLPAALDMVSAWAGDAITLFGMPDTIFSPDDAMTQIIGRHEETQADLTLGLFPTDTPRKLTMVTLEDGRPVRIIDKPQVDHPTVTWGIACWSRRFSELLEQQARAKPTGGSELLLSTSFQAAIDRGLRVESVSFNQGQFLDIGTPQDLMRAVSAFAAKHSKLESLAQGLGQ